LSGHVHRSEARSETGNDETKKVLKNHDAGRCIAGETSVWVPIAKNLRTGAGEGEDSTWRIARRPKRKGGTRETSLEAPVYGNQRVGEATSSHRSSSGWIHSFIPSAMGQKTTRSCPFGGSKEGGVIKKGAPTTWEKGCFLQEKRVKGGSRKKKMGKFPLSLKGTRSSKGGLEIREV